MLVLSRRIGETLQIGDDILVTIQNINGNQVKVSISAPRHIPIHREEVARRISQEQEPKPVLNVS